MVNYMRLVFNLLKMLFQALNINLLPKFNVLLKINVPVEVKAQKNVLQVQVHLMKKFMRTLWNLMMKVMMKKMVENLVMLLQLTLLLRYQNWGEMSQTLNDLMEKMEV